MPKSPASSRALNHVTFVHGMLSAPVTLYTGTNKVSGVVRHEYLPMPVLDEAGKQVQREVVAEDGTVTMVDVYRDVSVGRGSINKDTGDLLDPSAKSQVQAKVETEYGPVFVDDHEIEKLFTLEPNELRVIAFQPIALFTRGEYVPKDILHVEPAKVAKKHSNRVTKFVVTLFEAMRDEGVMAVCELTTRGTPKPCILMPDGRLWLVYNTEATREQRPLPEVETDAAEIMMFRQVIGLAAKNEVLDLADTRSSLIQAFAEEKAAAGDFGRSEDTTTVTEVVEPSSDLMAMLAASVEAAKAQRGEVAEAEAV